MPLSIAIMTCPPRAPLAAALHARLPDAVIVMDTVPGSPRLCAARAWIPDEHATHHLVIQDDAELCDGFLERVAAQISATPNAFLSLFSASPYARRRDAPYLHRPDVFTGSVALVAPAPMAREIAACLAASEDTHDDVVIARFLACRHLRANVVVPNLVDHLPVPSTMGHRPLRSSSFAPSPADEVSRG